MTYPSNVGIASDHAGFQYKIQIKEWLISKGLAVADYGTESEASCDYPDFAHPLADAVETGKHPLGIVICGSGNGVCMAVNKHAGIRGAMAWTSELAELARQHNDANILCLSARFYPVETAIELIDTFLSTEFEGGRHQRRVNKI